MRVFCKNTECFWHSDTDPNQCERSLIVIAEDANCKMVQDNKNHHTTENNYIVEQSQKTSKEFQRV